MSTQTTTNSPKDVFGVCQQSVDNYLNGIKQTVPQYHQSVTSVQQEYLDAVENIGHSIISLGKEFARKAGITTNVPDAALKVVRDTTEGVVKATSIQNQVLLSTIDATRQNIKTLNDNAKSFADLNRNILQSWISVFTSSRNN